MRMVCDSCAELYAELEKRRPQALSWAETTEEIYDEQLGALPPMAQLGSAFLMGECVRHENGAELYAAFWALGNRSRRYLARLMTLAEFRAQFQSKGAPNE